MIVTWASQYDCDRCRAKGPLLNPTPMRPDKNDGWTHLPPPGMVRPDGYVYHDLCTECSALPLAEVMRSPDGNSH